MVVFLPLSEFSADAAPEEAAGAADWHPVNTMEAARPMLRTALRTFDFFNYSTPFFDWSLLTGIWFCLRKGDKTLPDIQSGEIVFPRGDPLPEFITD